MPRKRIYSRPYVGIKDGVRIAFRSVGRPTPATHDFTATIGPFHTMAGARFMADHGASNPHCRSISEAERLAKRSVSNQQAQA